MLQFLDYELLKYLKGIYFVYFTTLCFGINIGFNLRNFESDLRLLPIVLFL